VSEKGEKWKVNKVRDPNVTNDTIKSFTSSHRESFSLTLYDTERLEGTGRQEELKDPMTRISLFICLPNVWTPGFSPFIYLSLIVHLHFSIPLVYLLKCNISGERNQIWL